MAPAVRLTVLRTIRRSFHPEAQRLWKNRFVAGNDFEASKESDAL
jgi:hypothetical protein